jgi:hypothetical protein
MLPAALYVPDMETREITQTIAPPSRIARFVGGKEWPSVQFQKKVAAGVYGITSAGHGGLVAVFPAAFKSVPQRAFDAALATGRIYEVVVQKFGRKTDTSYSCDYTPESWAQWRDATLAGGNAELHHVWPAEEDCECLSLLLVSQDVRDGEAKLMTDPDGYRAKYGSFEQIREMIVAGGYIADFLDAFEGRDPYRAEFERLLDAADFTPPVYDETATTYEQFRDELKQTCDAKAAEFAVRDEWQTRFSYELSMRAHGNMTRVRDRNRLQEALAAGKTRDEASEELRLSHDYIEKLLADG